MVSLRWCKDHDVNELVNKLRFHNASNITVTKMESRHAKWKVEVQNAANIICNILQISCNMKGSIFQMSQMSCKMRGSISTMHSVVCFAAFLALMVSPVFFLLGFAKFYRLLDFMALFVLTCSPQPKPQL